MTQITLGQLEQEIARRAAVWEDHVATGGTTTPVATVAAATLVTSADDGGTYVGQWLLRRTAAAADDRQRRIVGYTPATGLLTLDRPYEVTVSVGEAFEITPLDPIRHLRRATLAGLGRCFFVDRASVPVVAGQVEQSLSSALFWIVDVGQIRDVESLVGAAGTSRPSPLDWYRPFSDTSGVSVGVIAPTGGTYLVEALRPYATRVNGADAPSGPSTDTDTLDCPLDYAAAAGHVELWRYARAILAPVSSGPQALAPPLSEATATFEQIVKQQWWYWDRPDRVRFRYPTGRTSSAAEFVTGLSWSGVAGAYSWRGLSALTWRQVLGG